MDAKTCPWCQRWCLKDNACNYIFACGLQTGSAGFVIGAGCGRSWCWGCGKKFCGLYYDQVTGLKLPEAKDSHDAICCLAEGVKEEFCAGGCSSHCARRW
uniref:Uncharacterized protein n=1 Tax=viral metagenome TaxID=1070528 RepID=A0A6C0KYN3_9ZZZZ